MALCLVVVALFALAVPPRAPMAEIDRVWWHVLEAKAGTPLAALVAWWAGAGAIVTFRPGTMRAVQLCNPTKCSPVFGGTAARFPQAIWWTSSVFR